MTEFWFKFSAYNSQALYGYGTQDQASQYEDKLNWSRAINHYSATQLSEDEANELCLGQSGEAFDIYEVLIAENSWQE